MFANCNSRLFESKPDVRCYGAGGATVGAPAAHQLWQQQPAGYPTPMFNGKHQQNPHSAVQLDTHFQSRPSLPPNFRNAHSQEQQQQQQQQCIRPGFGPQQQNGNFNGGGSQGSGAHFVSHQFANNGQPNPQWNFNGSQQQPQQCPQAPGGSFGVQQGHQPPPISCINISQEQTALLLPVPVAAYVQSQLARLLGEAGKNQSINLTSQPPPGYICIGDNCVPLSQLLPSDMKLQELTSATEPEKKQKNSPPSSTTESEKSANQRAKIGQLKEEDWEYLRSIQPSEPSKHKAEAPPMKEKPRSRFSDAPPPPPQSDRDLPADPRLQPRSRSRRNSHKESHNELSKRRERSRDRLRERSRERSPVHSKRPPKTAHIDASLEANTKPPFWNRHLNITVQCYASRTVFPSEITEKDPRYVFYCAHAKTNETDVSASVNQTDASEISQSDLTSPLTKKSRFT